MSEAYVPKKEETSRFRNARKATVSCSTLPINLISPPPLLAQLLMFPEGTTTNGTVLIKFKPGE